jgi:FtsP/CotA-like multicopper oxidase with cupredoxin domain
MRHLATFNLLRRRALAVLALTVIVLGLAPVSTVQRADAQAVPSIGIVCATGVGTTPSFTLTARDGYIGMTDGNTVYMWSYALNDQPFQYPGPFLCVNEGDTVTVVLRNLLPEPVSVMFPGQVDVLADGAPAQPVFNGTEITSLVPAADSGGSVSYSFVASRPGTFVYESGTDPSLQVQMGLGGMLVVRPAGQPTWAYGRADTAFKPGQEYAILMSEIDPLLHQAEENGYPFDMQQYKARYWLYNGRGFPDTLSPNGANWIPDQPYSSFVHIHPYDPLNNPLPALIRWASVGNEVFSQHPHGNDSTIIARNAEPFEEYAGGESYATEEFAFPVNPTETVDALFKWHDAEGFDPVTHAVPITVANELNLAFGPFYGSPYLGNQDPLPPGTVTFNVCGEYYHISHNHYLQQLTGWGTVLTGQVTFTRIDPPLPNSCP